MLIIPSLSLIVGKKYSPVLAQGMSSSEFVTNKDIPQPFRILKPGDIQTMDMDPKRVNVILNENDIVQSVYMG
jgi:Peptidase inhibitor I78 family